MEASGSRESQWNALHGEPISGDLHLTEGRQFQIGSTFIGFTTEFRGKDNTEGEAGLDTVSNAVASANQDTVRHLRMERPTLQQSRPEIDYTTDKNKFLDGRSETGQAPRLVRLGLKMGAEVDVHRLCDIVLEGLFEVAPADIGAVLLFKDSEIPNYDQRNLDVVAFKSLNSRQFERVSDLVTSKASKHDRALLHLTSRPMKN